MSKQFAEIDASNTPYPEHVKLQLVKDKSQVCGEFLEFLENRGTFLAEMHDGELYTTSTCWEELLAMFFGIDLGKLEAEKKQMLAELRAQKG